MTIINKSGVLIRDQHVSEPASHFFRRTSGADSSVKSIDPGVARLLGDIVLHLVEAYTGRPSQVSEARHRIDVNGRELSAPSRAENFTKDTYLRNSLRLGHHGSGHGVSSQTLLRLAHQIPRLLGVSNNIGPKRKALCIGINYFGQKTPLEGCVNDARNFANYLITCRNYPPGSILLLTDDIPDPRCRPTKTNICNGIRCLVADAQAEERLCFYYSGHGGQIEDIDGDEMDGYDEGIVPEDASDGELIIDDVIVPRLECHQMSNTIKPLPPRCRLSAVVDSCNSGSILDLPYQHQCDGPDERDQVTPSHIAEKSSCADVTLWSSCRDFQVSAETTVNGKSASAMTSVSPLPYVFTTDRADRGHTVVHILSE
ncbi:hypothetical protein CERSUDRAFT_118723 [Gelatoporia subvermispora B]|uniref:Peptidase C14 caspase domain-containing protein n=1 Tax=Ceriporiopsis subvermispora (strain B) TaxID=914234 RepID=M2PA46_CERS8|nr:hypothetical protein CERSUDRAFT_118723 [Gelatoporia subvermispora B]